MKLNMINKSKLKQRLYFYPLPKVISYDPFQIPITLMPNESKEIEFTFRGFQAKKYEGKIVKKKYFL